MTSLNRPPLNLPAFIEVRETLEAGRGLFTKKRIARNITKLVTSCTIQHGMVVEYMHWLLWYGGGISICFKEEQCFQTTMHPMVEHMTGILMASLAFMIQLEKINILACVNIE